MTTRLEMMQFVQRYIGGATLGVLATAWFATFTEQGSSLPVTTAQTRQLADSGNAAGDSTLQPRELFPVGAVGFFAGANAIRVATGAFGAGFQAMAGNQRYPANATTRTPYRAVVAAADERLFDPAN